MSPVAIVRYKINETWATALRGEYYRDIDRIIVSSSSKGFTVSGISINLDYAPLENILCRVEGRWLHGVHQIFNEPENQDRNNFSMTASFALKMR
ncbi:MAG: outer membrane beta-barrel protein [Saprospiraceae bacterium]|nr:outer membrane beta-barrel protein [Saprospiraceae bacterium]